MLHQQPVQRQRRGGAVGAHDEQRRQAAAGLLETRHLAGHEAQPPGGAQRAHGRLGGGVGLKAVAPVQQGDAGRAARGQRGQADGLGQRRLAAADHDHALAGQLGVVGRVVKQLPRLERLQAGELQAPGHKGAHAGGDEHGARQQAQAALRLQQQAAVGLALQLLDQVAQVQWRRERRDLRHQRVDQRLAAAHRDGRNVVDRLVGVQRGRLAADMGQGVDDLGAQPQQAELEHREQADRAGADHGDVGFQRRVMGGVGHECFKKQSGWRRSILRQPAF